MEEEAEDLVTDREAADAGTDPLDDTGEVAPESDRKFVLGHLPQPAGRDEQIDGVHGGGMNAHEQLVVAELRLRDVVAQGGLGTEAVEGEGAHHRVAITR
jgi:hypothetical protein